MTALRRFYARLFAATAIPFGILMLPWNALMNIDDGKFDVRYVVGLSAIAALLYGAFMAALLGRKHVRGVEALTGMVTAETLNPRQRKVLFVPLSPQQAFDKCVETIRAIPHVKNIAEDRPSGMIEAKMGGTMKSWGELITVRVQTAPTGASVEIESRPSFKPTIADYGTNLRHVLAIERALTEAAPMPAT